MTARSRAELRAEAGQLLAEARELATRSARIAQLTCDLAAELLDGDDSPQFTVTGSDRT